MELKLGDKTYVAGAVKARAFRKAIEITEQIDFNKLKTKDLDTLIDFLVVVYEHQFTRDELYDGLPADKLMSVLSESISGIVGGVTEKLESKNE